MFVARAGLKTRNFRDGQSGLTALLAPKRKNKDDIGFYCWVPFMLGPCIGGFIGLVVLLGGTAMCATGYYAKYFASNVDNNGTHLVTTVDSTKQFHMHNLTFIGPVIMGCGCFVIVIACVVVCEQRDKEVRVKIAAKKKKGTKKNKFYDSVVERLKHSNVLQKDKTKEQKEDKTKIIRVEEDEKGKRRKSSRVFSLVPCIIHREDETSDDKQYIHISEALRSIPMDIFTVNMDQLGQSSLLPVRLDPTVQIEQFKYNQDKFPPRKYPSAACIQELVKIDESRLNNVFPDRQKWLRKSKTDFDLLKIFNAGDCTANNNTEDTDSINKGIPSDPLLKIQDIDKICSKTGSLKSIKLNSSGSVLEEISNHTVKNTNKKDTETLIINDNKDNDIKSADMCKEHDAEASTNGEGDIVNVQNKQNTNIILCEASVHKEQVDLTQPEPQLVKAITKESSPNLNVSENNDHIDVKVLALTSGLARANAAEMDGFKRPRSIPKEKKSKVKKPKADKLFEPVHDNSVQLLKVIPSNPENSKAVKKVHKKVDVTEGTLEIKSDKNKDIDESVTSTSCTVINIASV